MIAIINNPKISRSGMSVNFQFNGKLFSAKIEMVERIVGSIENFKKISIDILEFKNAYSWIMIEDFTVTGKVTNVKKASDSLNLIKPKIKASTYVKVISDAEYSEYEEDEIIKTFKAFSPFEMIGEHFADSYIKYSFKIWEFTNLNEPLKSRESYISVLQNFILRGTKIKRFSQGSSSASSIVAILELFKRGYIGNEFLISLPSFDKLEEIFQETKALINAFSEIIIGFETVKINAFLENVSHSIKINSTRGLKVINKETKELHISLKFIKRLTSHLPMSFITDNNVKYNVQDSNKKYFDALVEIAFYSDHTQINELKMEQFLALENLMNKGVNVLAVLKTGFGKSLIYQFSTLLQPRIFLNVFPINSLIKDQSLSIIQDFGIGYSIDNEKLKGLKDANMYQKLLSRKRLFLITPERLENKKMQTYFTTVSTAIGFMIFDEAHCISEWGHDFRPSYLMSRHLMESIRNQSGLTVLALTATAAPHIQNDIAKLLGIQRRNIINIADGTGLERKEIKYKLIKESIFDYDKWYRSVDYARIIDNKIWESRHKYTQGIAFFMRSGSHMDLEGEKFHKKINAFSAFKRIEDKENVGLYTGNYKYIGNNFKKLGVAKFNKFQELDYIVATKSFGMGVNLKKCDYVLLAEPPYSLEDLYQQSGRVGRMGQDSVVEILYHQYNLINPLSDESPYKFFLNIDENRRSKQIWAIYLLIKYLIDSEGPIVLNLTQIKEKHEIDQEYIQWALAHLITEFKLVDKYFVEYGFNFKIKEITIFPKLNEITKEKVIEILNHINAKFELKNSYSLEGAIEVFYRFYFNKLQADKLIGIKILIEKLLNVDQGEQDASKLISDALNSYYKTRIDSIDELTIELYELMTNKADYNEIKKVFTNGSRTMDTFEIMESISRHSIQIEYIKVLSLIMEMLTKENMLIDSIETVIFTDHNNAYLNELKENIFKQECFLPNEKRENILKIRRMLVNVEKWGQYYKKVNEKTPLKV